MFNQKEYIKKWQKENKEHLSKYRKEYRKKNIDKILEYNKKYKKKYYQKNKEKIINYNKKYANKNYYEKNKEHLSEYKKQWHKNNPEYNKNRRKNNPEYHNKYQREWKKTEKGKANNQRNNIKRRIREREIINTLTAEEWLEILKEYKFRCAYCNKEFTLFDRETRDHIIPISKGGDNIKENIIPACRSCNSKKGDNK